MKVLFVFAMAVAHSHCLPQPITMKTRGKNIFFNFKIHPIPDQNVFAYLISTVLLFSNLFDQY